MVYCRASATPSMRRTASEWPWLTPGPQKVSPEPSGKIAVPKRRIMEKRPGSQPVLMTAAVPPALAAASTLAKCSGTRAWVSKVSTTQYFLASSGVCTGRSVALPPQRSSTSTSAFPSSKTDMGKTGVSSRYGWTVSGARRVKMPVKTISSFCSTAASAPRPTLPYPTMPTRIILCLSCSAVLYLDSI